MPHGGPGCGLLVAAAHPDDRLCPAGANRGRRPLMPQSALHPASWCRPHAGYAGLGPPPRPVGVATSGELFTPECVAVGIDEFDLKAVSPDVLEEAAGGAGRCGR